jgi:hypothetical protein
MPDRRVVTFAEPAALDRGTYVIGKTGTGKSTLLEQLILRDILAGMGLVVLDPHGDLIDAVIASLPDSRRDDVTLLDVLATESPFGLNPFACNDPHDPLQMALAIARVMQVFERLWGFGTQNSSWGPRLEQHLRHVAIMLIEHRLTMAEAPLVLDLEDGSVRQSLSQALTNSQSRFFWRQFEGLAKREKELRIESTENKIDAFVTNPVARLIFGQEQDTVDWGQVMDQGQIVLVKLSAQLPDVSTLVGSVIAGRILEAALARAGRTDRRRFTLYADEYQRFATEDFAKLLTEPRKYGVPTTVAHQFRDQLDDRNRGATLNAGAIVCFQLTPPDSQELAGVFDATPPEASGRDRPVRVPSGEPVPFLVRNGHPNPRVRDLTEEWLRPLMVTLGQYRGDDVIDYEGDETERMLVGARQLAAAVHAINAYLTASMRGVATTRQLAEVIAGLAGMLGVMSQQSATTLRGRWGGTYYSGKALDPDLVELLVSDPEEAFSAMEQRYHHPEGVEKARQFYADLLELGELLVQEPILVASGRYEVEEGAQRTYADVLAQIGNRLATLPAHVAMARVGTQEGLVQLDRPRLGSGRAMTPAGRPRWVVEAEIQARHARLRERSDVRVIPEDAEIVAEELPPRRRAGPPPRQRIDN